jgi:CheY-like chemotaxis protein
MMTMPLSDTILVVDDDGDNRERLVEYLQAKGFTVYGARNGVTALRRADALRPRVILMDLAMPTLDGLETTRRLRANASLRETTIVAVTAGACETRREDADRAGCNFFFQTPPDLTTLAKFVHSLLHPTEARSWAVPHLSRRPPVEAYERHNDIFEQDNLSTYLTR